MSSSLLRYRLSRGVQSTISPPIPQAWAWAASFTPTPTRPLLDVSQGAPSAPPPPALLRALADAAGAPASAGYSNPRGDPELPRAVTAEMREVYGRGGAEVDVSEEDIAVTAGCNMAYVAVVMTLADAGDEIILPVPWYFNHQMTNNLLGITTVPLPCHYADGFMPSPERAASLITPRTKALVLVSPNNPTGAVYPPALLAKFAALARDRNIALILDETYRDFILEGSPHHLFSPSSPFSVNNIHAPPDWTWRSTLISLYSFSKAYHIPGHRMGLMVGAPALVTAATTVLDCLQICGGRPVQRALGTPGLLHALRPFVRGTAETLGARHAAFARAMAELAPRWRVGAQGGYYAFVRAPFARGAREVCERLAAEDGVVALPAEFFAAGVDARGAGMEDGWERWLRVSVANVEEERLVEVARRLGECAEQWGWEFIADAK